MVRNVGRTQLGETAFTEAMNNYIVRFKGLTRQRDFYAHCIYDPQKGGTVLVRGFEIVDGAEVVKQVERRITKGMRNEIRRTVAGLDKLNAEMWNIIDLYQRELIASGELAEPLATIPEPLP